MERIIVGILFSDVAGFSKLSQPGLERYSTTILPELENIVIHPHRGHLKKTNTWGDAIMLVSNDVSELADLALSLRDFYKNKNWAKLGIVPNLSVRIALHLAAVSHGLNAIVGEDDVFGHDLTVAARIEPIIPPNMIYTTEQFRNHIQANHPIIKFDDLGNVPLAKDAGERHLFHLRRMNDSPSEPISSARDRLLAVRESGPRLSPEDAEMLNSIIQEARDASIPDKLPT